MTTEVKIYFDGGAAPTNPGNGYGSFEVVCATSPELNHRAIRQQFGTGLTNNQAEYMALMAALEWLTARTDGRGMALTIVGDSQLVVYQLNGKWKSNSRHIRELRNKARLLLMAFDNWMIQWRPRKHSVKRFGH